MTQSCPPPTEPGAASSGLSPVTRDWFASAFHAPTPAQTGAWQAIAEGAHTLVVAPTGSGKTLAAFLTAIDDILTSPVPDEPGHRCRVLYVSPLKALASDVERNLRGPIAGIAQAAARAGVDVHLPVVATRSGDTSAKDRREFLKGNADLLITTPESLFLLLTSQAREQLRGIHTVIVDEVHAVAGTKRGAHLAVSLERLDALLATAAQRIGLSATVRPVEEVARFLTGAGEGRPTRIVAPPSTKEFELQVVVPVPDLAELSTTTGEDGTPAGPASIWPHVEQRVVDLVAPDPNGGPRSSIVFTNSRRLSERLTARLNEVWQERVDEAAAEQGQSDRTVGAVAARQTDAVGARPPAQVMAQAGVAAGAPPVLARAHHGSVSKEQRLLIEDDLKSGRLPAVVATSSLELGIDMGAVDLVVQVESPPSVASGLQRVGRAGHQVGAVSRGVIFPKFRSDLVTSAVVAERMLSGQIEALSVPANPLDVLAQHIVAMVALQDWTVPDLLALMRRSAPFANLGAAVLESVLDMLAGRYPSEDFAELRPRLVWDRVSGTLSSRAGSQRLAVTSGGTIPDRGLFGVFLASGAGEPDAAGARRGGRRVGELDEEMVYESRVGDVFTLGASSWQIVDITYDQVLVVPAPGRPGKLPFWHGDQPGRPYELGRAVGAFVREVHAATPADARARLTASGLDAWASDNLLAYLSEQAAAIAHLPDDRTIVVERFRDELGDWRVVIHSPFGREVHAPWAMAIAGVMRAEHGIDVQAMPADDGIVLRLPDTDLLIGDADPLERELPQAPSVGVLAALAVPAEEIDARVQAELGGSALFASRFRECAARALLLPRRRPDRRSPLWQQRQRSAQLLEVAARYPTFPIILETVRECLVDVFDVPSLRRLLGEVADGRVRLVEVETEQPSPFARSLLFGYVAQFLYEPDTPLAERRAAALALDPDLLAELLGTADAARLCDLLDPDAVRSTHAELQRLVDSRRARTVDDLADLVRVLGPMTVAELVERADQPVQVWLEALLAARRVIAVRVGGLDMVAAVEDAGRLRDALGTPLPVGLPVAFTEIVADPLGELLARQIRFRAAITAQQMATRWGLGVAVVTQALERLRVQGRLVSGDLLPSPTLDLVGLTPSQDVPTQYSHTEVMRLLRRRSLAALRAEVEPVPARDLARFVTGWQHVDRPLRGVDGVLRAIEQLVGVPLPASAWESLILPARVSDYSPAMLDELISAGEGCWVGHGRLAGDDGWISLHLLDSAEHTMRLPTSPLDPTAVHAAVEEALVGGGAFFARQLIEVTVARVAATQSVSPAAAIEALWDLIWAGRITGDTFVPIRALLGSTRGIHRSRRAPTRARYGRRPSPAGLRRATQAHDPAGVLPGRWSALPRPDPDPTVRAAIGAEVLLDRYGVLTRGAVMAEDHPGGFAAVYRVLSTLEEQGRVRRGYFVEGLGASQFAAGAAVDRLRAGAPGPSRYVVLAATDPANVYGASLAWPPSRGVAQRRPSAGRQSEGSAAEAALGAGAGDGLSGHRPARRAGALVVLADGELVVFAERGARSLLTFTDDPESLAQAFAALAQVVASGRLPALTIQTVDGAPVLGSGSATEAGLLAAGFHPTTKGLRLRR